MTGRPARRAERSLLLVKPDGVAGGAEETARDVVRRSGLEVADRLVVELSVAHLAAMWPEIDIGRVPLEAAFLERYLCGPPLPVLVVAGPDAVTVADAVKHVVRARHAAGTYANAVHAPGDAAEANRELAILTGERTPRDRPPTRRFTAARQLAWRLWDEPGSPALHPGSVPPPRLDGGAWTLSFENWGHRWSLDDYVDATHAVHPRMAPPDVLRLVLSGYHDRLMPVATGTRAACAAAAARAGGHIATSLRADPVRAEGGSVA